MCLILRLAAPLGLVCGLMSNSCSLLGPLESIENASIQVVDRFDAPQAGAEVRVTREKKHRRPMQIPCDEIASATTDTRGLVTFENLTEKDLASASTRDGRFYGSLVLIPESKSSTLKLNRHSGFSVSHTGLSDDSIYDVGSDALQAILDYYVETRSRAFLSLDGYVASQVLSEEQAAGLFALRRYMLKHGETKINFYWSYYRLVLERRDTPLRWEASDDPLHRMIHTPVVSP